MLVLIVKLTTLLELRVVAVLKLAAGKKIRNSRME
jgi:hypothetical protein